MAQLTGTGAFFITVFLITILGCTAWLLHAHVRAKRLGLPQPTLSSYNPFGNRNTFSEPGASRSGVVGWAKDKIQVLRTRHNRTATGGYEEPLNSHVHSRAKNRGFGPLDPDEAWDSRVGVEADAFTPTGYSQDHEHEPYDASTGGPPQFEESRGRTLSRAPEPYIGGSQAGLDRRYDEEMGRRVNPFADTAEPSNLPMRDLSPRPLAGVEGPIYPRNTRVDSPSRRSVFREDV